MNAGSALKPEKNNATTASSEQTCEELDKKILRELDDGMKKSILDLMAATSATYVDLCATLRVLESDQQVFRTSDGFQVLFVLR
jgi:excinuclease UvrABC nuclease subunit